MAVLSENQPATTVQLVQCCAAIASRRPRRNTLLASVVPVKLLSSLNSSLFLVQFSYFHHSSLGLGISSIKSDQSVEAVELFNSDHRDHSVTIAVEKV
ncbi:unnamed protein product [Calypogeia fissa]